MKTLVVDDKPDNVELLSQILEDDYDVISAYNGADCIELAKEQHPDLILLDVMMPILNGYDVLEILQEDENTRDIPVIFLTAEYKDTDRIVRGLETGAVDYITKPIQDEVLLARIRSVIRIKKAEDEVKRQRDDLKRVNKELKVSQEQLVRKNKLITIGKVAGSMAHELRNPLAAMETSAYYLSKVLTDASGKVKKHLDIIHSNIRISDNIISEIVDFSNTRKLFMENCDISKVIENALKDFTIPENIIIETRFNDSLPEIPIDIEQILRLFKNLISNSIQAMPDGGRLDIETNANGDYVEVKFMDTGVGIPEENLENIFEPLYTTKAKGMGLGLMIVQENINNHKGTVEVESEVGRHTIFTIKLPVKQESQTNSAASGNIFADNT